MSAPPFAYYGGKTRLADRIVDMLPPHTHYVEPFAGGLSVLLAKPPVRFETVNDIDGDLMLFWRVLRDRPLDLARVCGLTPHSRAEHAAASDRPDCLDEVEMARRVWVRLSQGRSGRIRMTGWRNIVDPSRIGMSLPAQMLAYTERLLPVAERLQNVSLESRPALDLVADYGEHPDVCLYVDPPYSGDTGRAVGYEHEMRGEVDHRELADALRRCAAGVVLSGYHGPLYDELYADWDRVEINTMTGQAHVRSPRVEVLWTNRPAADHLFSVGAS